MYLPAPRKYTLSLIDVVTLLDNICRGAEHPVVGFEDANRTLDDIIAVLNGRIRVTESALESALWSANLMNEAGEFWDPRGRTFDQFLRDVLGDAGFDKFMNTIERKNSHD